MNSQKAKEKENRRKVETPAIRRKADQLELAERREKALACHFQKKTLGETRKVLQSGGFDVSLEQIRKDIQTARRRALEDIKKQNNDALFNRIAEMDHLKREAWQSRDLRLVLEIIKQECKLLGLETLKIDMTTRKIENMDKTEMDEIMDRLSQAIEVPYRDATED